MPIKFVRGDNLNILVQLRYNYLEILTFNLSKFRFRLKGDNKLLVVKATRDKLGLPSETEIFSRMKMTQQKLSLPLIPQKKPI